MFSDEVELLSSAAQRTERLLITCQQDGLELDLEEERKALKKYTDMVNKLGAKIEKDVKKISEGKGRWWERMKIAGKKNGLAGYMMGIERAKTLVIDMEMKIMINLQHDHRDVLNNTNRFLESLQSTSGGNTTTINRVHAISTAMESWTETADVTLNNLSRGMEDVKSSLNGLAPAIQQLKIAQHHDLSNLEHILESAAIRGFKRHSDEVRTDHNPKLAKTVVPNQALIDTRCNNENGTNSYTTVRGYRSIHRSRFQTPIFDIEFVTKEAQRRPTSPAQSLSTIRSEEDLTDSQRITTCKIRIKPLSWGNEMSLEPGSFHTKYRASFHKCLRFRIYNIVPMDSPIIQACQNLDLPEVRRLFETGHASPQDCCDYPHNESLVAIVFTRLFTSKRGPLTEATKGVELLKFLIHCLGGDIGFPGGHFFSAFNFKGHQWMSELTTHGPFSPKI
ncbi:hypothetical protein N431DRAFT_556475 [Stipitochalara longipes BDJ]|nr:hypothetical protein N431DRAFT_556475 [Stipitochalara longipes BDJ]